MRLLGPLFALASRGRTFLLGFGLFFLLGTFVFFVNNPYASSVQPIAFSHSKHIEAGLTCTDCHAGARDQARATLPTLETCLMCHEAALTEGAEEEKLRALAAEGKELLWTKHTAVPPHVYFSHRRHVELGGLDCAACHGLMETLTEPPPAPLLEQTLTMDGCIECHEQNEARTDCGDCHI